MENLPHMPSFSLDGRRALVTGAGRGIGLAAACALAEHGAHVDLVARSQEQIEAAAQGLRDRGRLAQAHVLDVTDIDAASAFVAQHGPYDVFVNNAGMNRPAPLVETKPGDYDAVTDLNVRAAYFLMQAVARGMIAVGKGGSIINMSSQMGHVGGAGRTVYCATKHAVEGFTKAAAWELGAHDIRVNALCPTFIRTPMTAGLLEDSEYARNVVSKIAVGRVGEPEDLMGAVVFLAGDASRLVTGASLLVDGGWTAQ